MNRRGIHRTAARTTDQLVVPIRNAAKQPTTLAVSQMTS